MMMVIIWLMMVNNNLVDGFNPSEKYEFVSWDYYSQYMEKKKLFQTTNQLQHGAPQLCLLVYNPYLQKKRVICASYTIVIK